MHNVVITGGAGFIGHHLVKRLVNKDCKVKIIDNLSNSNNGFLDEFETNRKKYNRTSIYNEDVRNDSGILSLFNNERFDTCIHLAAKIGVQDSILRPSDTMDVNVKGTLNVLEACRRNNVQNFILASSAAVYGNPKDLPASEDTVLEPISPYGASKVAAEALVSSYRSKIRNCLSLRFFNVYGKGQTLAYAGVITKFIERLSSQLSPVIYGDGSQTRDFISVNDVVNAIILAGERGRNPGYSHKSINTFNIGTGRSTSILEIAFTMIDIFGLGSLASPIHLCPMSGDIMHTYAKIDRAKNVLKFVANEDLRSGITSLIKHSK